MINLIGLNEAQKKAVKTCLGPVLCLAGAGSGKTTTLTYRVANLIDSGIPPNSILLLTFTKKAANDMLDRVKTIVGDRGDGVEGGTFHHFAIQIISKFGEQIGIKSNFTVIDEKDSADIINSIRNSNSSLSRLDLPSNKHLVFQMISRARNCELSFQRVIEQYYRNIRASGDELGLLNSEYSNYKRTNALLDYDDLLDGLLQILKIPEYQRLLSEHYKYLMVDEYQDTNIVQARIADLLAAGHGNIMVVGDDAQSIYSFRGSVVDNILQFSKRHSGCQTIKLEQNYRNSGYILDGCNSLINKSNKQIKKRLFSNNPMGSKIAIVRCLSEKEEAIFVTQRIIQLYKSGYKLREMAVLFRNSNHSYELEIELVKRGIPFQKSGGHKIFDAEHIRDVIAYLRVLNNPYDKISWIRILMQMEGIGLQTANSIFEQAKEEPEPFNLINIKGKKSIKESLKSLSTLLLNSVAYLDESPVRILNFIIDYYLPKLKNKFPDSFNSKIKDLDQIALIASKYPNLREMLPEMFVESHENLAVTEEKEANGKDRLSLSTIHSAKGLEWRQVFIVGALEGRFPSQNSYANENELEEERRLMYVAMTRAREGLTISYPSGIWDKISRDFLTKPSRFISEISPESLEVWQIKH